LGPLHGDLLHLLGLLFRFHACGIVKFDSFHALSGCQFLGGHQERVRCVFVDVCGVVDVGCRFVDVRVTDIRVIDVRVAVVHHHIVISHVRNAG